MNCRACGVELAGGAVYCQACGTRVASGASPASSLGAHVDRFVDDTSQAASELASAAIRFSERTFEKAKGTAHDPEGAVRRALERTEAELDRARAKIEKALKEL